MKKLIFLFLLMFCTSCSTAHVKTEKRNLDGTIETCEASYTSSKEYSGINGDVCGGSVNAAGVKANPVVGEALMSLMKLYFSGGN